VESSVPDAAASPSLRVRRPYDPERAAAVLPRPDRRGRAEERGWNARVDETGSRGGADG